LLEKISLLLNEPLARASAVSLAVFLVALLGYLILRRRMAEREEAAFSNYLGVGILLLALLVLVKVWMLNAPADHLELYQSVFWTALSAVIFYAICGAIQKWLLGKSESVDSRHKIRRTTTWASLFAFGVTATVIWSGHMGNVGVFLGIVGAGVALSLQETLLCMAGWLLVMLKKPFDIGDRIEVQGQIGDVIDVSLFHTSILEVGNWVKADQSTGRIEVLPNSYFFRYGIHNYTKGFPFIWNELPIVVTFESDWKAAKELLLAQALEEAERMEREVDRQIKIMQNQYAIHYQRLRPIVYTSIADQGVRLTLRYLSPVRERRASEHRISEAVLEEFIRHPRIDFAYPTTRIFRNSEEGKVPDKPVL
jgi:small-conductance mechanosensitive channel